MVDWLTLLLRRTREQVGDGFFGFSPKESVVLEARVWNWEVASGKLNFSRAFLQLYICVGVEVDVLPGLKLFAYFGMICET